MPNHPNLLAVDNAPSVEMTITKKPAQLVFIGEHSGRTFPKKLAAYSPQDLEMSKHIAFDIGAEQIVLCMAKTLGAPLIFQRHSCLVIDCNRPRIAQKLCSKCVDGTNIGFNKNLCNSKLEQRWQAIHQALAKGCAVLLRNKPEI